MSLGDWFSFWGGMGVKGVAEAVILSVLLHFDVFIRLTFRLYEHLPVKKYLHLCTNSLSLKSFFCTQLK